jgi:hypothetical protein
VTTQSPAAQTWRQAGGHQLVDRHGTPGTDLRPGPEEQIGLRANTTTTSTRSTSQPRASRSPRTVGVRGGRK